MIHETDIPRGFTTDPMDYSYWAESMIVSLPENRLNENMHGICSEVGELHGKMQRSLRDGTLDIEGILYECGDIVFYATVIANYCDSNLNAIMEMNMAKLNDRAKRGVIKGSGDKR